jgi:hypothetical protein
VQCDLTPAKVQVFSNGEFSIDEDYSEVVVQPYMAEQFTEQFAAAATSYSDYYRDPGHATPEAGAEAFVPAFVEAFRAEYGISPEDLISAQFAIEKDAISDERLIVRRNQNQIRQVLVSAGLSATVADRLFDHFSLWPRGEWDKTPTGFTSKDWYPWRYRRRLSLVARPFVRLDEGDNAQIIFAPGIVDDSIELLFSRLLNGRLPAEYFSSTLMRSWIGEATRRRGDEFEDQVAIELRAMGLNALVRRPMTQFGADESYGDIDVLAWTQGGRLYFPIECKRLRFARTVAEIGEQLRDFKGEEADRLAKHVRRCQWLEQHHSELRKATYATGAHSSLIPLLVTSTVVPMQFIKDLPLPVERIVSFSRLRGWIERSITNT